MNRGEFRDSSLDRMTGKPHDGSPIPDWHQAGQYDLITQYVEQEAAAFCKFYAWLLERLPAMHMGSSWKARRVSRKKRTL